MGLSLSTLNNPFFVQIRNGAEEEAKKLGEDLTVTDAQNDASQQANQLQNFVSRQPVRGHRQPGGLRRGRSLGAARRTRTTSPSSPWTAASTRRTPPRWSPRTTSRAVSWAPRRSPRSSAARAPSSSSRARPAPPPAGSAGRASRPGLKQYPGIKVVAKQPADFDRTKGLDVMTNLLQAHPDVDGVFAENDEMALGAIKALGSQGRQVGPGRRLRRHPGRAEGGPGRHVVRLRGAAAEGTGQDRRTERAAGGRGQEGGADGEGAREGRHQGERGRLRGLRPARGDQWESLESEND